MSKIALVTGATAGIGKATAEMLVKKGYRVILTGRREDVLNDIVDKLLLQHNGSVLGLNFDIRSKVEVDSAIEGLPDDWKNVDILINNAGLAAGLAPIQSGNNQDWEQMIDTNIKGLLYITRALTPGMMDRKSGHIINIGSIAGREVYPNGNVYCATKHAVDALTKAMRVDLLEYGIKVTQIAPGAVETEFSLVRFKGDEEKASAVYDGYKPLSAQDISECIEFVLSRPAHVNINDMLIMPTAQASAHALHRETPDDREW